MIYPIDNWPEDGGLVHTDRISFAPGGTALNTAYTIKKLGVSDVTLLGFIGSDDPGEKIKNFLTQSGMITDGIIECVDINTGVCLVNIQSTGARSFMYSPGANDTLDFQKEIFSSVEEDSFVHLGGVLDMGSLYGENLKSIIQTLKDKECFVSMDLAWDWRKVGWNAIEKSLYLVDLITMNSQEAQALTGKESYSDSARKLFEAGCPFIVIKLGNRGAYLHCMEYQGVIPGFSVSVKDTTGAGDAFSGALIVALCNNLNLFDAIIFANAVGASCVQEVGSTKGILNYRETMKFIKSQESSKGLHRNWL